MQTLTSKQFFLNNEVATSYETSKQNINNTKNYHADELVENIHFIHFLEKERIYKGGKND